MKRDTDAFVFLFFATSSADEVKLPPAETTLHVKPNLHEFNMFTPIFELIERKFHNFFLSLKFM